MRAFATAWPEEEILQQAVAQLPWGHITVLLDRLDEQNLRDWYAGHAAAQGWSRNVLEHQIRSMAHTRLQAAQTNFAEALPQGDSDLAQQITKDPYVLDFLALDGDAKERHLEQALGVLGHDVGDTGLLQLWLTRLTCPLVRLPAVV